MVNVISELSMIILQPGGTQTLTEFDVKWRHWHEEVDHCLQDNSFASNKHLEVICKVSEPWPSVDHVPSVVFCNEESCLRNWNVPFLLCT